MSGFETAFARYTAARQSAGAPAWAGPADEADIAELQAAVEPFVVPDQMVALWRHVAEGRGWLVDAGDLVPPSTSLEMWQELRGSDRPPFPPTLLPIAFAGHVYLTVELDYPGHVSGGALLRVPFEGIERVAPDVAAALDVVTSAIADGHVRWTGSWWDGVDVEELQRSRADDYSWPAHLATVGSVTAVLPLTWPSVWQLAAGIDPAEAEPLGANTSIASLASARSGTSLRIVGRVLGLVGSGEGSLVTLDDGTARIRCWCSRTSDPFFVVRRCHVIEVDLVVQDADMATDLGHPSQTVAAAPDGRFVAIRVRLGGAVDLPLSPRN